MSPAPTDPRLMDGTAVSRALLAETAQRADRLTRETGRPPIWRRCWWVRPEPR
jgi:hypothetical protein